MMLLLSNALAWQSICFVNSEVRVCKDGLETARERWVPTTTGFDPVIEVPEHAWIWSASFSISGLPDDLSDEFELVRMGDGRELTGGFHSVDPVTEDPMEVVTHKLRHSEFTQLPDMSFSMWDWARGNEACPVDSSVEATACHTFSKHMGALNSSHFPPQSRSFYAWYHDLALERAKTCKTLHDAVWSEEHLRDYVLACEQEALLIEAVAQHYLQDQWAMGHMWERWGGPEAGHWAGLGAGVLVGALSGTQHGAKGLLDTTGATKGLAPWDDPLNAPPPSSETVEFYDPFDQQTHGGVGDIFLTELQNDPTFRYQRHALYGCGIAGMRQVYAETGQGHGAMNSADGNLADLSRDPTTDSCWGPRATNESMQTGSTLHHGAHPLQKAYFTSALDLVLSGSLFFKFLTDKEVAIAGWDVLFRLDTAKYRTRLALAAKLVPEQTTLASGGADPVLLASPNSAYAVSPGQKPATWVDPSLPWLLDGGEQQKALNLAFADSHAMDRCTHWTDEDLKGFKPSAYDAEPSGADERQARHRLCEQMVGPHLRVGTEGNVALEPLCLGFGTAFVLSGDEDTTDLSFEDALDAWCEGGVLVDGSFDDAGPWQLKGGASVDSNLFNDLNALDGPYFLDLLAGANNLTYAAGWQELGAEELDGDWVLGFWWQVVTDVSNTTSCSASQPWFNVRLTTDAEAGVIPSGGTTLYSSTPATWCNDLDYAGGGAWYRTSWKHEEVAFSISAVSEPNLVFMTGTSYPDAHHVMLDDVTLEPAD